MIIGYARTSTADQIAGLEAQLRELSQLVVKKSSVRRLHLLKLDPNSNLLLSLLERVIFW